MSERAETRGSCRRRHWGWLVPTLLVVGPLVAGCGAGGGGATGQLAAGSRAVPSTAPTLVAGTPASRSSGPTSRTTAEIQLSAPTSKLLDGRHLRAGVACEACHGSLPQDRTPAPPDAAKCLSCHGGSNEALAAKTASLGERNPHAFHDGSLACTKCHLVHQPFVYYCNTCHTFPVPTRYQTGS